MLNNSFLIKIVKLIYIWSIKFLLKLYLLKLFTLINF